METRFEFAHGTADDRAGLLLTVWGVQCTTVYEDSAGVRSFDVASGSFTAFYERKSTRADHDVKRMWGAYDHAPSRTVAFGPSVDWGDVRFQGRLPGGGGRYSTTGHSLP